MPPTLFFFLKTALAVWGGFVVCIRILESFSYIIKNAIGVLIEMALDF